MIIKKGNDVFVPLVWKDSKEVIAFSLEGYKEKRWELPEQLKNRRCISVFLEKNAQGKREVKYIPVNMDGSINLSLKPREMIIIA